MSRGNLRGDSWKGKKFLEGIQRLAAALAIPKEAFAIRKTAFCLSQKGCMQPE